MEHDLNPGSRALLSETLRMAWPAVLESFFVSLASMIDTLMVSSMGSAAVAAVGLTNQPKYLCFSPFLAINVAVAALVARRLGEQKQRDGNRIFLTAFALTLAVCAVVSGSAFLWANEIIRFCGSKPDTHADAVLYFRIIIGGQMFHVISLVINAAQRGSGNTRIAMTTNVTSSVVNMCGNYLLIGGHFGFPALGIRGAALATVLGTVVACVMSIRSLFRREGFISWFYLVRERVRPKAESLRSILKLSGNILMENLCMRVGFMTTAITAASLGTAAFAAHQVGMNVLNLAFSFGDGMQAAAVALIGRSLGARRPDLAKRYGGLCQRCGLVISITIAVLLVFFGRQFYHLFFEEPEIIAMGVLILRYLAAIVLFQVSQIVLTGCLRGAGDVRYTLLISIISVTVVRSCITWGTVNLLHLGLNGIWLGILFDQATRLVCMSVRFRRGRWCELKI